MTNSDMKFKSNADGTVKVPITPPVFSQTMNLRVVRFMEATSSGANGDAFDGSRPAWRLEQAWISNEGEVEWHKVDEVTE